MAEQIISTYALRSAFLPKQKFELRPCSVCRGYALERSWCDACNQTGVVKITNNSLLV